MSLPVIVLDANILIRATHGKKVRDYLIDFSQSVDFFTPDVCIDDAEKYLPLLFKKLGMSSAIPLEDFYNLKKLTRI